MIKYRTLSAHEHPRVRHIISNMAAFLRTNLVLLLSFWQ